MFLFAPQNTSSCSTGTLTLAALLHMATNARSRQASMAGKVTFPLGNSSPALEEILIFRQGKFLAADEQCLRETLQTQGVFCMVDGSKEALLAQTQPSALKLIPERKIKCLPEALDFCRLVPEKLRNPLPSHCNNTGHSCFLSSPGYQARNVLALVATSVGEAVPTKPRHKREEVLGTGCRRSQVQPQKIHYPITCEKPSIQHSWKYPLGATGLHELEENWEGQPSHLLSVELWERDMPEPMQGTFPFHAIHCSLHCPVRVPDNTSVQNMA